MQIKERKLVLFHSILKFNIHVYERSHYLWFCFVLDSVPNINLQGAKVMINQSLVYTFNCSSDFAFELCTVEFLADNRTNDYVTFSKKDECIHLGGNCNQTNCACSMDCKSFVWMFTVHSDIANMTIGCRSRMEENDIRYIAQITVKPDGNSKYLI